jgi:2'-5' RNA ligase
MPCRQARSLPGLRRSAIWPSNPNRPIVSVPPSNVSRLAHGPNRTIIEAFPSLGFLLATTGISLHSFSDTPPHTLAIEDRDYIEWRQGRERYGIWMIDVDFAAIRERVAHAREHLHDLLCMHQRSPHITLFVCGFLVDKATLGDDFDPSMLELQRQALGSIKLPPFTLNIGALDSFDSAVFLRIEDDSGGLAKLRTALAETCEEIRQAPYTAHVTVGLYRDAFDKREVARRLSAFGAMPPLPVRVERVHFATYAARDLGGDLTVEASEELSV